MEGNRLPRKVRDWISHGKRNLRIPKLRWKKKVKQGDRMDATSYKAEHRKD
jgi:hypothetical protein